jgi:hypothetical protein
VELVVRAELARRHLHRDVVEERRAILHADVHDGEVRECGSLAFVQPDDLAKLHTHAERGPFK